MAGLDKSIINFEWMDTQSHTKTQKLHFPKIAKFYPMKKENHLSARGIWNVDRHVNSLTFEIRPSMTRRSFRCVFMDVFTLRLNVA